MSAYSEKLKDPRWQKKRLAVIERANWKCEGCGSAKATLHVHHGYYERGKAPWDYDDATLHVLCEECHLEAGALLADVHGCIARCQQPHAIGSGWCDVAARVAYLMCTGTTREFDAEAGELLLAGRGVPCTPRAVAENLKHLIDCLADAADRRLAH